jgi:hypothetical protein
LEKGVLFRASTEICGRHLAFIPNGLLGQSGKTDLWTFVTVLKKSWYPFIKPTFQKGIGYGPFTGWL